MSGSRADADATSEDREQRYERRRHWVSGLPLMLFVLGLCYVAFLYGFASGKYRLPPYDLLRTAYLGMQDLRQHWRNDLGLEPTRLLVPAGADKARVSVIAPGKVAEGQKFIAGLSHGRDALFGAILLDRDGTELHYWPIDYERIDPDGKDPENVYLHGVDVFPDGSIIVNFDEGNALARVDACGEIIWSQSGHFHHAVSRAHDGTIWTLGRPENAIARNTEADENANQDDFIVQLDQDGRILRQISMIEDVILANNLQGIFAIRASSGRNTVYFRDDPFHMNDIEVLDAEKADAFPLFDQGDLLISLRDLNLVAVLDKDDYSLKWSQIGPWFRQHDPDFLEDGRISVLNNNMGFGRSKITVIDPRSGRWQTVFEGRKGVPFYTWQRGKHEHLENDNLLLTETERGRVLEVDASGELVWEYQNIFDETRNGVVSDAKQLPSDFFEERALTCPQ